MLCTPNVVQTLTHDIKCLQVHVLLDFSVSKDGFASLASFLNSRHHFRHPVVVSVCIDTALNNGVSTAEIWKLTCSHYIQWRLRNSAIAQGIINTMFLTITEKLVLCENFFTTTERNLAITQGGIDTNGFRYHGETISQGSIDKAQTSPQDA